MWQQTGEKGSINIASVSLSHYRPEEISVEVDNEKLILHGQHVCEREDGFDKTEFMRVFKLPQGVDPTSVTSRITQDGGVLVIEAMRRMEEKANDGKIAAKLDVRGFKPENIKIQLRGNELTVTGEHVAEGQRSRVYRRRTLLPSDVDPSSVTSRLSKEGLLTIEASRNSALLQRKRSVKVTMETEADEKPKQATSSDAEETRH